MRPRPNESGPGSPTPEERAAMVAMNTNLSVSKVADIAQHVRAAVAEERQAIAKVVKAAFYNDVADVIYNGEGLVAAILARGQ